MMIYRKIWNCSRKSALRKLKAEWSGQFGVGASYLYHHQHNVSEKVFTDVFSDASKQKFIKIVEDMNSKCSNKSINKEAAVLVPLCRVNGKPSVLLTVRSPSLGTGKGDISFPGGLREASDEDLVASALRETEEEIGIPSNVIQVWVTAASISMNRNNLHVTPVVASLGDVNISNCVLNTSEVEEVFAPTLESLCNPNNFYFTEFQNRYILPTFLIENYRIWGLTAGILHHFLKILLPDTYKNKLQDVRKRFKI